MCLVFGGSLCIDRCQDFQAKRYNAESHLGVQGGQGNQVHLLSPALSLYSMLACKDYET